MDNVLTHIQRRKLARVAGRKFVPHHADTVGDGAGKGMRQSTSRCSNSHFPLTGGNDSHTEGCNLRLKIDACTPVSLHSLLAPPTLLKNEFAISQLWPDLCAVFAHVSSASMHYLTAAANTGPLALVKTGFDRVWDWASYQLQLGWHWLYVPHFEPISQSGMHCRTHSGVVA